MATPTSPPSWNWTAVTGIISIITLVVVLLGLLCAATWFMAIQSQQIDTLKQQVQEAKQSAEDAKKLQSYQAGVADSHNQEKQEKKK